MALLLHIESTTHVCSVALSQSGQLVNQREDKEGRSHASLLSYFVGQIMEESAIAVKMLDGVSISMGPGSYTGLRIGVSTAKGLCYGADLPLIGIPTLRSLTQGFFMHMDKRGDELMENSVFVPLLDARRMEVYSAVMDRNNQYLRGVQAEIIDENAFRYWLQNFTVYFFGNGTQKVKSILSHRNARFVEGIDLSASYLVPLAEEKCRSREFEDLAYFEPFYLKDFIATKPKKNLLGRS
jgi:tRNA threonylcarbamoyladenosine biosynthesis protein TsaB